jgi:hypothetical protein
MDHLVVLNKKLKKKARVGNYTKVYRTPSKGYNTFPLKGKYINHAENEAHWRALHRANYLSPIDLSHVNNSNTVLEFGKIDYIIPSENEQLSKKNKKPLKTQIIKRKSIKGNKTNKNKKGGKKTMAKRKNKKGGKKITTKRKNKRKSRKTKKKRKPIKFQKGGFKLGQLIEIEWKNKDGSKSWWKARVLEDNKQRIYVSWVGLFTDDGFPQHEWINKKHHNIKIVE